MPSASRSRRCRAAGPRTRSLPRARRGHRADLAHDRHQFHPCAPRGCRRGQLGRPRPGRPIALPLVQVAAGVVIGFLTTFGTPLRPELFFLILLPPLLFFDGWRVSKTDLAANAPLVLSLALGLVVFTVAGVGVMLHLLIPAMPPAVCFALAAVLSPTDVAAAGAIATHISIPTRILRLLEAEALFNDAAALICLRLAVAAALTGIVPGLGSFADFAGAAGGGIAVGGAFSWAVSDQRGPGAA
ncbi:cation:proton antiporter [Xanthobacter autotrophicus]|uniref:cation:proton antiporter domain-containing protein n=1 Tax=Xanthobacter autotrophicus TaxID=280 RepID=UPI003727BFE8